MYPHFFRAAILAAAFAALNSSTRAVTYTATLLHPDDFLSTIGSGSSNGSQVGQGTTAEFGVPHAMLWQGAANSFVDLNGTYTATYGLAATDTYQIGDGYGPITGGQFHSLLWSGSAGSVVDLHPATFDASHGIDIDGTQAVGYGYKTTDFLNRAMLWDVTNHSFTNLHPSGFVESFANGVSGDKQAGYGLLAGDVPHALLWTGSAASKVDLNPAGFTESYANDVHKIGSTSTQIVGSGAGPNAAQTNGETHALLWTVGIATSKVDLHPTGFSFSEAIGISAAGQVGDGFGEATSGDYHALHWNGAANTVTDLHSVLFAGTGYNFVSSSAYDIAPNGNIIGTATDDDFNTYAILWTPTPSESGVAGDYNNNGKVDPADYVTWRKGNTPLHNEVTTIGSNTPGDYTEWRTRFGNPQLTGTNIPEPSSLALFACCFTVMWCARGPRSR